MAIDFNDVGERPLFEDAEARKARVKDALQRDIRRVVKELFPRAVMSKQDARVGDLSGQSGQSLSIALGPIDKAGQWIDHATDERGDVFTLLGRALGMSDFKSILAEAEAMIGGHTTVATRIHEAAQAALPDRPKAVKVNEIDYIYTTPGGEPLARVRRLEYSDGAKSFVQSRMSGGAWVSGSPDVRPPYNLPGIVNVPSIVFVEGEKCADALIEKGYPATCVIGGSNTDFDKLDLSYLAEKQVTIWPDNDDSGIAFAGRMKGALLAIGCDVRIVEIPRGKPAKWDAADAIEAGEDVGLYLDASVSAQRKLPILSLEDLGNMPPVEWLIDGLLVEGGMSTLYAPSETFKSFIALDMGLSVACGQNWRGRESKAGPVVYLIGEGVAGWPARVFTWLEHRADGVRPEFWTIPTSIGMTDAEDVAALITQIKEVCDAPAMVVVDTLARNFGGGDENSTKDMNAFVSAVDHIREATGAHVMLVHHTGKDVERGGRGSSVLRAALDTEMQCRRDDMEGYTVELAITKQKDIEKASSIWFEMRKCEASHPVSGEKISSLVPVLTEAPERPQQEPQEPIRRTTETERFLVWVAMNEPVTLEMVMEKSTLERGSARKKMSRLINSGQIHTLPSDGPGYYRFGPNPSEEGQE